MSSGLEKALPRCRRPGRPISVSAVPLGPGIDIWRSCRFIGGLMWSPCTLPGGPGRFLPCRIGASHCRFRHIGWEKCGHGLASRPWETFSVAFLVHLWVLFRYPPYSAAALLEGVLPLRYCPARFAGKVPLVCLPRGSVADLLTEGGEEVGIVQVALVLMSVWVFVLVLVSSPL